MDVVGKVAPGFEGVREEFAALLAADGPDPGAQLAAYVDGRLVVDLWGGDEAGGEALTGVFSITKGAAHLTVALLVQEGVLDLEAPVRDYWTDFPAEITLRELPGHRSGLIGVPGGFTGHEPAA